MSRTPHQPSRFAGCAVLITGSSSGIGAATAERFVSEGARVTLIAREEAGLQDMVLALGSDRALPVTADVSKPADIERAIGASTKRWGRLDVVVTSAGFNRPATIEDVSQADWEQTIAVVLSGVFHCARAAMPHLVQTRGRIVNVASVSGLRGDWGMVAYDAAKGGVANLTRALALDAGRKGVRVNAVAPGLTRTPRTEARIADAEFMQRFAERSALGRPGEPQEVAAAIAFLASDDAAFITGVVLPVDGGLTASNGQPSRD